MNESIIDKRLPFALTLAADAHLAPTDYLDDHIWELMINQGDPPGISLDTTYGLRARKQRIFPRFGENDIQRSDPAEFFSPVTLNTYIANYTQLTFSPLEGIRAVLEYWIPNSHSAAGRITLLNQTNRPREVSLIWAALLAPSPGGSRMAVMEFDNVSVLGGKTGGLEPVFFMSGGAYASTGPFPALELSFQIEPGKTTTSICTIVSESDALESFNAARALSVLDWDAEKAQMSMLNAAQIEIITGEPAWDKVFTFSQTVASTLVMSPTEYLPRNSFVLTRQPDQGFSIRGDGSDYNHLWNGQTALHSWFISQELMPITDTFLRDLLENFFFIQTENGMIDWKPGLGEQRSCIAATPMLAYLMKIYFLRTQDKQFVETHFPGLLKYFDYWFTGEMDRDQDGIPEWEHPWQTGLEDQKIFSYWLTETEGVDISTFECPDLNSWLSLEGESLIYLADLLGDHNGSIQRIRKRLNGLKEFIISSWDEEQGIFHYRDRNTHQTIESQILFNDFVKDSLFIQQAFTEPVRLQFHVKRSGEDTRKIIIFIHGTGPSGGNKVERLSSGQFRWFFSSGYATSDRIYTQIEKIIVEGCQDEDVITISTVGHTDIDISLMLPLFARIPTEEMAAKLAQQSLLNEKLFFQQTGISNFCDPITNSIGDISILWNSLLMRGLIYYHLLPQAAEVMTRVMNTLKDHLEKYGCLRRVYDPVSGEGKGEKNILEGLAPIGTFLKIVGIEIFSPWRIQVQGTNPFSWAVTVKYQGTTILKQKAKTTVIFPDGQTLSINDEKPHILALE